MFFTSRALLFLCALLGLAFSGAARAQTADGAIKWNGGGAVPGYYPSAYEACKAQWQYYQGNKARSRYIGAKPGDDWRTQGCQWTSFQYLCPEETGGGINNCGTILPTIVSAVCPSGYTPTVDGHCRSSPAVERPCVCDEDGRINPTVGNPIVLSTGAKILSALDFETADGDFRIGRRYRSFQVGRPIEPGILPRSTARGLAGGWILDLGYEIQLGTFSGSPSSPSAKVAVLAPDGTGFGFVLQANGQWIPDPAAGAANAPTHLKLEFVGTLPADLATVDNAPSHWKLIDGEDNVWTLRTRVGPNGGAYHIGWPTQKVRRDGYAWTFAYNSDSSLASISDSFGRTAAFSWYKFFTTSLASPPAGTLPYPQAIASIALPDGTSLRYTYDPPPATAAPSTSIIKRLIKVERRSAASAVLDSVTYLYEDGRFPTHVTGIVDNRGVRIGKYAYDTLGRGTLTEGADGSNSNTVQYVAAGTSRARRVTNPLGKAATYTFGAFSGAGPVDYRLTQIAGEASPNTPASTASIAYGSNTFVGSLGDAEARVTVTQRDSRGRPTAIVEGSATAAERTTTIAWHPTLNVPATLARSGLTETRAYNSIGQLETVTLTDTTGHTAPYSTQGQARTYTYGWASNGRLLSINGPLAADAQGRDDVTAFTYDAQGDLLTATDALGRVTTFAGHDSGGRPGTITDPNGIVTAYGYDGLGRVQTITVQHPGDPALNATTAMSYDAAGHVTGLTLPATETLAMDYDPAGRLVSVRAADGGRWDYAYDSMGNVTLETVKRSNGSVSRRVRRGFDELGRLIRQTTGVGHTARVTYDKVGNVVSSISPNGHATTAAFDALDRVVSRVAPDSGTTGLAYDARDNLVSHTDPIAVTTQFVHNGFGDVIREVSPDRGTSTYWYDAAGELVRSSDGRGQVVDYARDYLGRLTGKVPQGRPASETVAYHWDSGGLPGSYQVGRLAKVVDGSGTTRFQYDHRGNLLAKEQTIGSGSAQLAFAYDPADRITHVTYPSGRIVRYGYDGKGRVNLVETRASASAGSWTLLASGHSYEPFGAVKAMTLGNGLAVAGDWGNDGRLASRRLYRSSNGTSLSDLAYRYDADDNIGAIDDRVDAARSVRYGYDSVGRLSFAGMSSGGTAGAQSYAYTAGTNRLASTTDSAGTRTIAYDGRGNTLSEARPGSVGVAADYDGYGRLIGYDRSGSAAQAYVYNGLDDRVTMAAPGSARHFVYDSGGRVLGEYGASAADVKAEFIWAVPQGANDGSPYGGADGVGGYAPLAVATPDDLGSIQLNWVHGNHLGVPLVTTDSAGAPAATPNDYLLPGFPGQSRVFADLYYNRYRDYDSATGRYIQADPIGLGGGSNPYLYAEANPINLTDPTGEFVPILAGIAIGVGMEYFTNPCATWMDLAEAGAWGGLLGGTGGVAVKWFRYGKELKIGKDFRIAPFGNRNPLWNKPPHKTGRWPHYHKAGPKRPDGSRAQGHSIDRHRPWDKSPADKSWKDRLWPR